MCSPPCQAAARVRACLYSPLLPGLGTSREGAFQGVGLSVVSVTGSVSILQGRPGACSWVRGGRAAVSLHLGHLPGVAVHRCASIYREVTAALKVAREPLALPWALGGCHSTLSTAPRPPPPPPCPAL